MKTKKTPKKKSKIQEYREGPQATKIFEDTMKALFRAPKTLKKGKD